MRISLRYKILGVLGFLLIAAVSAYTALASLIFREEKVALLYDINHSTAVNAAAQLRSSLIQIGDQLKLYVLSEVLGEHGETRLPTSYLQNSPILGTRLFKKAPQDLVNENLYIEMKTSGRVPSMTMERTQLVPLLKEAEAKGLAFWNSSDGKTAPRFFVISKIEIRHAKETELYFPIAELNGKPFFQALQEGNIFKAYLVKENGEVLLSCTKNQLFLSPAISNHPLLKEALLPRNQGRSGAAAFEFQSEKWLGAFAPIGVGSLFLISQTSEDEIYLAIATLLKRSALFGLIVLTITFIASILFSKKLTSNLRRLTEGTKQIGEGNLKTKIDINSGDEVHELASSFNSMIDALRSSRDAIEKYNRELESKVAERTAELHKTNAQIKEVQEKLLKTTQLAACGEVAGRAAHEVLNPLTAILSRIDRSQEVMGGEPALPYQFSEILGAWESDFKKGGFSNLKESLESPSIIHPELTLFEEDLDNLKKLAHFWKEQTDVVSGDLKFMFEQARRIHRIIDGMREMSRSSIKADVNCEEALKEAVDTMSDFIAKQGIKVTEEFHATQWIAHLNRDELIQIVTNLIRNAFQAILGQGDPSVWKRGLIKVRAESTHHLLTIDVIDNGPGIPESKISFLFEQGFTTKAPREGTGLGLSICRRYAHAFGGEVELLYSEPSGRGTCFRLTIPLREEPALKLAS